MKRATPPAISVIGATSVVITGQPEAIASTMGQPNPSATLGNNSARACEYAALTCSLFKPGMNCTLPGAGMVAASAASSPLGFAPTIQSGQGSVDAATYAR